MTFVACNAICESGTQMPLAVGNVYRALARAIGRDAVTLTMRTNPLLPGHGAALHRLGTDEAVAQHASARDRHC